MTLELRERIRKQRLKRDETIVNYWLRNECPELEWEKGVAIKISAYTRQVFNFRPTNSDNVTLSEDKYSIKFKAFMRVNVSQSLKDGIHVVSIRIDNERVNGRSWFGWRNNPENNMWLTFWAIDYTRKTFDPPLKKDDIVHLGVDFPNKQFSIMLNDDKNTEKCEKFEYEAQNCNIMVESVSTTNNSCEGNEFTLV